MLVPVVKERVGASALRGGNGPEMVKHMELAYRRGTFGLFAGYMKCARVTLPGPG